MTSFRGFRVALMALILWLWLAIGFGKPVLAQMAPDVTTLASSTNQLTIASFNVENLDPGDGDRVSRIANLIVNNLKSPDILGLTEIQDNNGAIDDAVVNADKTYKALIDAIATAGGPAYSFVDIDPEDDQDGGEPGGNIRPGFIYQANRISLTAGRKGKTTEAVAVVSSPRGVELSVNPGRIQPNDPAFNDSRKPLVAAFKFQNQSLFVVLNHLASKRGDNDPKQQQRQQQASLVNAFVKDLLAKDTQANVVVMGDLNDTPRSRPLANVLGQELTSLTESLPKGDQYTFKFKGKLQQIDYILVSQNLKSQTSPLVDIVHANVNFPRAVSDHDPVLAQFSFGTTTATSTPSPTPTASPLPPLGAIFPDLTHQTLLAKLTSDYKPKVVLSYDKARDELFGKIDNQNGSVSDIYTNFTISVGSSSNPSQEAFRKGLNTEHTWPQSKGAEFVPPESDLHHLFPARIDVNSARGNKPFGEVADNRTSNWYSNGENLKSKPATDIDAYSELGRNSFEPRESKKGNIARAMFYFYTLYRQDADAADPVYFDKQKADLCAWNRLDPPDAQEVARSKAVSLAQGNENPFVLDPTLPTRVGYCS